MFKLEYINETTTNEWEVIGEFKTEEEAFKEIARFWESLGHTISYYRQWKTEEGYIMIDFGSHVQFYRYKEVK